MFTTVSSIFFLCISTIAILRYCILAQRGNNAYRLAAVGLVSFGLFALLAFQIEGRPIESTAYTTAPTIAIDHYTYSDTIHTEVGIIVTITDVQIFDAKNWSDADFEQFYGEDQH